ncbi:MAG: glutamate--tRNA ligase [Mariprofundaceae bacterium]
MSAPVITRFAPSPTGRMHPGNVRTALLNWLFARAAGGRFLLRFEDTDADRSDRALARAIMEDLRWLGLDWDGEPDFQSAHAPRHREALDALAAGGHAYRCFCTEAQLALDRKLAASRGLPPRYKGRCRGLAPDEARRRAEAGEPFVWRLALHQDSEEAVAVRDLLRGEVRFARRDLDDPVIVRSDGSFTFLLPNAVDDAADGVTHVLRGDDHLTNSAAQVWMLARLGRHAPVYAHHGLLLAADGGKLSKRAGAKSLAEWREAGVLPMALVQALARLGHPNMPEDARSMADLLRHFEATRISTAAVRWSDEAVWRWHTRLLQALSAEELAGRIAPVLPGADAALAALLQPNLERERDAQAFARLRDPAGPLSETALAAMQEAGAAFFRAAIEAWDGLDGVDWKAWVEALKAKTGRKGRALFLPLRAALTGADHGPEMSRVVAYLGRDGVRARLVDAMERCE